MALDDKDILDFFPEDHEGRNAFSNDDEIIVARIFNNKAEAQIAVSLLRTNKIPHFLSDGHSNIFTENILAGERLFIRKQDMEEVADLLKSTRKEPFEGEEEWYKEVRTQQGYQPYQKATLFFIGALLLIFIFAMIIIFNFS